MPDTQPENRKRFDRIFTYLRKYKKYLLFGGMAIVAANGLNLINPFILKVTFDKIETGGELTAVFKYALLMVSIAIAAGIFRFFTRRTIIWMSRKIEYDLRADLFSHLLKLDLTFYNNTKTGDIMARSTNDIEAVRMMIGPGIMQISNAIVSTIIGISFMLYLSPKLTLYSLLPLPLLSLAVNRLGMLVHERFTKIQEYFSVLTSRVQENLSGVRVIRAYNQEEPAVADFNKHNLKYIELNVRMIKVMCMFYPLMFMLAGTVNLAILYFGGREVMAESISLGTLMAFFAYLTLLIWPMIAMGWVVSLYQRGTASLDRINKILYTRPNIKTSPDADPNITFEREIKFENLNFSYNGKPTLKNIELTIKAGMTIGVIGPTASGKSTLASLITRMFPVERGMLFVDGIDINDWDLNSLRSQIGFVSQEPFLFSDTIAENILFSTDKKDYGAAGRAARIAAIDREIETFPDQYGTMLGERGITLSGGQKQRLAIARAIIADPRILILDDATSAIDTETEHLINQNLRKELSKRTAIIISHRVSAVKDSDMIIFLDQGTIVESGTHEEMLALSGKYESLYRAQLLEEELKKM